jgi:hypothetical protein
MVVTVFPSPAGVGVIAVVSTSLPLGRPSNFFRALNGTFAMYLP